MNPFTLMTTPLFCIIFALGNVLSAQTSEESLTELLPASTIFLVETEELGTLIDELEPLTGFSRDKGETSIFHQEFTLSRRFQKRLAAAFGVSEFEGELRWEDLFPGRGFYALVKSDSGEMVSLFGLSLLDPAAQSPLLRELERLDSESHFPVYQCSVEDVYLLAAGNVIYGSTSLSELQKLSKRLAKPFDESLQASRSFQRVWEQYKEDALLKVYCESDEYEKYFRKSVIKSQKLHNFPRPPYVLKVDIENQDMDASNAVVVELNRALLVPIPGNLSFLEAVDAVSKIKFGDRDRIQLRGMQWMSATSLNGDVLLRTPHEYLNQTISSGYWLQFFNEQFQATLDRWPSQEMCFADGMIDDKFEFISCLFKSVPSPEAIRPDLKEIGGGIWHAPNEYSEFLIQRNDVTLLVKLTKQIDPDGRETEFRPENVEPIILEFGKWIDADNDAEGNDSLAGEVSEQLKRFTGDVFSVSYSQDRRANFFELLVPITDKLSIFGLDNDSEDFWVKQFIGPQMLRSLNEKDLLYIKSYLSSAQGKDLTDAPDFVGLSPDLLVDLWFRIRFQFVVSGRVLQNRGMRFRVLEVNEIDQKWTCWTTRIVYHPQETDAAGN